MNVPSFTFVTLVQILCLPRISTELLGWLAGISDHLDLICRDNSCPQNLVQFRVYIWESSTTEN